MSDTPLGSYPVDGAAQIDTALHHAGRGVAMAAVAIPLGVLASALLGGLGLIGGLGAVVVGPAAGWLYGKGAGGPVRRTAWVPFLVMGLIGVLAATAAGTIAEAFATFTSVGGDGGLFGSVFATTLSTKLANGDLTMSVVAGLGLGLLGLVAALRGPSTAPGRAGATTAPAASTASAPPPPAPNAPSPGVILNGEPVDPDAKG